MILLERQTEFMTALLGPRPQLVEIIFQWMRVAIPPRFAARAFILLVARIHRGAATVDDTLFPRFFHGIKPKKNY